MQELAAISSRGKRSREISNVLSAMEIPFGSSTGAVAGVDSDGDGASNFAEWRAGTLPMNADSVLRLAACLSRPNGSTVQWMSVTGRTYTVWRCSDLARGGFERLAENIPATPPCNTYRDTSAFELRRAFYFIEVE